MKYILTLIAFGLQFQFVFSQITITSDDVAGIGSSFPRIIDTQATIIPGEPGENLSWDFSSIVTAERDTIYFSDVAGTPFANEFSDAEICIQLGNDIDYAYANISTSEINIIGATQYVEELGDDVIAHFEPNQTHTIFPATYGTSFNDNYGSEVTRYYGQTVNLPGIPIPVFVDSVKVINSTTSTVIFDAWGELITPFGEFSSIRSYRVDYLDNQLFAYSNIIGIWVEVTSWMGDDQRDTISTYTWWANNVGYPVFEIKTNYETGAVEKAKCLEYENLSTTKKIISNKTKAYPIPANNIITINAEYQGSAKLEIFDMTGSKVITREINKFPYKINIDNLSESLYFYKVTGNDKNIIGQGKFSIVH